LNKEKKILILVPAFTARGGISNYYQVLKDEWPEQVEYFERGARTWPVRKGVFSELIRAYKDYCVFKRRIRRGDIALVQSTTSLGLATTIRDGLFMRYAHRKKIKTIAFFRGWDDVAEGKTQRKYLKLFKYFFFHCDALIALSERTKSTLLKWGYQGRIYVETTLVDKHLIAEVNEEGIAQKFAEFLKQRKVNLLFLSRVEKSKGIYVLLEAYKQLKTYSDVNFTLTIGGDGFELEPVKMLIQKEGIEGVMVKGFISGEEKKQAFMQAHIFVFPSHGEGMPNAVLEAMGFGLPVITTPVGGLIDFFENERNGYFTAINNQTELAEKIEKLITNRKMMQEIALNNYQLATEKFSSEKVAERIMSIFLTTSEQLSNKID
jgi:glycosyltransferase involved in cell wall biosynthesis